MCLFVALVEEKTKKALYNLTYILSCCILYKSLLENLLANEAAVLINYKLNES